MTDLHSLVYVTPIYVDLMICLQDDKIILTKINYRLIMERNCNRLTKLTT